MKKYLLMFLMVIFILPIFVGCNRNAARSGTQDIAKVALPLKEPLKLTYWSTLNSKVASFAQDYGAVKDFQEIAKRTNIHIKWIHPPIGEEENSFNLLLASGDLPDMIFYYWGRRNPQQYIESGQIVSLNSIFTDPDRHVKKDLIDKYDDVSRNIQTDEGNFYMFPYIRVAPEVRIFTGLQIRKDWLDRLGLSVPQNIHEWYNVLKAFKTQDANGNGDPNDEIPLISKGRDAINALMQGYGVNDGFMLKDGKVVFGPILPEYKEALAMINKMYSEGLIYKEFYNTNDKIQDAKVTSNVVGAWRGVIIGALGKYTDLLKKNVPDVNIVGAPSLADKEGIRYAFDVQLISPNNGLGTAIAKSSKHIPEAASFLDYLYSDEGSIILNFGIEGESFNWVDGFPKYTDLILKNPDGLSSGDALARYAHSILDGPMVQDPRYMVQMWVYPQQAEASKTWTKDLNTSRILPNLMYNNNEISRYSAIMSDVNTYRDEMVMKFIMGTEPLSKFDDFVKEIKKRGIEEAIKYTQAAYERYKARK